MIAYTRFGSAPDTLTPILPHTPLGRPSPSSFFQVSPPSVDLKRPLPGPPLSKPQGERRIWYIPAKSTRGFEGSMARSTAPVFSST